MHTQSNIRIFHGNGPSDFKFYMEIRETKNNKDNLKKSKTGGVSVTDIIIYYKLSKIKQCGISIRMVKEPNE